VLAVIVGLCGGTGVSDQLVSCHCSDSGAAETSPNRAFVAESYLKNGDSGVTTRLFRAYVNIHRHDFVSGRNTVKHGYRTSGKELQP